MTTTTVDDVRAAIERQDWSVACLEPRRMRPPTTDPGEAAELADLRAEALWWTGRLDDCIGAREAAYRGSWSSAITRRRAVRGLALRAPLLPGQTGDRRWRGCGGPAGPWRTTRSAPSTARCCCERPRRPRRRRPDGTPPHWPSAAIDARPAAAGVPTSRPRHCRCSGGSASTRVSPPRGWRPRRGDALRRRGPLGPYSTGKVYCSLISACEELGDPDGAPSGPSRRRAGPSGIPSRSSRASAACTTPRP